MILRSLRLAAVAATAAVIVAACSGSSTVPPVPPSGASASPSAAASAGATASSGAGGCPTSQPAALPAGQVRDVTLKTGQGDIVIKVEGSLGPNAAGNFVALAQCGYYDGTVFHRLVPAFVIQGGDGQFGREPNVDTANVGKGGPGYSFADDPVTVAYTRGTVAMANSGPDTNGSQFFICLADLTSLAPNYSVFGHVTAGMDVVDKIAAMPNSGDATGNMALQPVAIDSATVTNP